MNIKLNARYREPVSAIVHLHTKKWLGFLKIDLLNPNSDGIALLKREQIFTLQLQDLSYVIGKVEKGFEFSSTASNRHLSLASPILAQYASRSLLEELIRLGSKRTRELESADVTIASPATMKYLLESPILVAGHLIAISLPTTSDTHSSTSVALSLPQS